MALLYHNGFDRCTSTVQEQSTYPAVIAGNVGVTDGRNGGKAAYLIGGSEKGFGVTLPGQYAGLVQGFAYKPLATPGGTHGWSAIGIFQEAQWQVGLFPTGTELAAMRGYGDALLGTSVGAGLQVGVWVFIEFKAVIHSSSGSVRVRVNGVEVLALDNVNTQRTANSYATGIAFSTSPSHSVYNVQGVIDDLYICSLTGDINNDFLGDVRSDWLPANKAGTYAQFTPSAGDNYQNVDEPAMHDGDTTYNEAASVGNKDSYGLVSLPSPPANAEIFGITPSVVLRKTDAGLLGAKILTKCGATEHLSSEIGVADTYVRYQEILELNPADASAFADADINSIEVGAEVSS